MTSPNWITCTSCGEKRDTSGRYTSPQNAEKDRADWAAEHESGACIVNRPVVGQRAVEPSVSVYPFHQKYQGMPQMFHVSCESCPEWGFCGEQEAADAQAADHRLAPHVATAAQPAEDTGPSDLPLRLQVIETLRRWLPEAAANEAWENGLAQLLTPPAGSHTEHTVQWGVRYRNGHIREAASEGHAVNWVDGHAQDGFPGLVVMKQDVTTTRTRWEKA